MKQLFSRYNIASTVVLALFYICQKLREKIFLVITQVKKSIPQTFPYYQALLHNNQAKFSLLQQFLLLSPHHNWFIYYTVNRKLLYTSNWCFTLLNIGNLLILIY